MFSQTNTQADITHPNTYRLFQKERYVEKKILSLIEQEKITEEKYQELYLMVNLNLDEYPLICKDIWAKIPSSYEEFKKIKSTIQSAIKERFSVNEAEFVYKTVQGLLIYLPANKMKNISELMKNKLKMYSSRQGYFDDFALYNIQDDNARVLRQSAPKWRHLTGVELQQEPYETKESMVGDWENDDHYNRNREAKHIENELLKLRNLISIMRSVSEYNDPTTFQKIELALPEELLAVKEIAYSFDLLNQPANTLSKDEIQSKLNQCLLNEKNQERIAYWVNKGANINASDDHGMTILGIFLSQYIPNKNLNSFVPKLLDLGIDVNIGINKGSNENNLMMALKNYKPDISDEIINKLIENSTFETINYANESGTALHYAIYRSNRMSCVKKLLDFGAVLTSKTSSGATPLIAAAQNDNLEAIELILNYNAKTLNEQDHKGDTALMCALQFFGYTQKTFSIIDVLILAGANLDLTNKAGKNAKQLATKIQSFEQQFNRSLEKLNPLKISAINNRRIIETTSYNREKKEVGVFSHYYSFYDYAGNIILYPVAAYATVYSSKWLRCQSSIYKWLESQPQPIKYNEIVSYFNYISSITATKPPIFDVDFRALTQILAVIAPPTSANMVQKILPHISDIADSVYGVTIGTTDKLEVSSIKKKLEENNLVIANVNKKPYENKFLIWVTASSDFIPDKNNLEHPDLMQQYWQHRNLQIQKNEVNKKNIKTIAPANVKIEQISTKQKEENSGSISLPVFSIFKPNPRHDKWAANYDRIKDMDIKNDEVVEAVADLKKEKMSDLYFDASISLSIKLEFSPYTLTRPMFFAFICLNANPNYQDYFGKTSLHKLIDKLKQNLPEEKKRQLINIVGWLLESGANPNLAAKEGQSPLSLAKEANLTDLVSVLTKNYSKVSFQMK